MSNSQHNINELIKFFVPTQLKKSLKKLALDRNISLSSLLRIITTEYTKRNSTV